MRRFTPSQLMAFADHVYAASEPAKHLPDCFCYDCELARANQPWRCEPEDTMTAEDRKEQFGEECVYCGKDSWTCEHFKPEEQGTESRYSSLDEGRNQDGTGESYAERNT